MDTKTTLILASGSPRRKELLHSAGIATDVMPANADETWPHNAPMASAILEVTRRKLQHVPATAALALAADTVVALDDDILGKPRDAEQARAMLARLSGRTHVVMTGFVLRAAGFGAAPWEHAAAVRTEVTFRQLSAADILRYIETQECNDKAGAYGIQGQGGALVATVHGSYTNIIGLPMPEVLAAIGQAPLARPLEPA
jgi:septum formation protein